MARFGGARGGRMTRAGLTYAAAGVRESGEVLGGLLGWVNRTLAFRQGVGAARVPLGHYAGVIDLGRGQGLAISTDSLGTKVRIAEILGRYDTLGIDCVAMNANDVLCVGAEPLAMVDYLAVQVARPEVLEAIGRGLHEGARQAEITLPGGELAQLGNMLAGYGGEETGMDLVGTAVGLLPLEGIDPTSGSRLILGREIEPGEAVLGLASSGIHSNGMTLARRVFLEEAGWSIDRHVPEFGRSLGEELLEPTRIYVRPVMAMLRAGAPVHGLAHITSGGLLNLCRLEAPVGYEIDVLPEPPPIFSLIARMGRVAPAEMHRVYNMGIGFCVVLPESHAAAALRIAADHGFEGCRLGRTVADPERAVHLRPARLLGRDGAFRDA
jgi:phosphoribosylformylglycinamidine cyclo-ligase